MADQKQRFSIVSITKHLTTKMECCHVHVKIRSVITDIFSIFRLIDGWN